MRSRFLLVAASLGVLAVANTGLAQSAGMADDLKARVAALKQSIAQSQAALRTYEWIETTTVSLKGEVKSMKQERCYYGADGALQKLPIAATPPPQKKRGLRGAIAASKQEQLTDTMKQAVALVKSYVPPDPFLIQRAVDSGKMSMDIVQPGRVIRLVFRDYQLPGDSFGFTMDLATNHLTGLGVTTYLNQPSSPVAMSAGMGTLADGTTYPASIQLAVSAQSLAVNVVNTGYRKLGGM